MTNIVSPEKKVMVKAPVKPLFDELCNNQVFENAASGIMRIKLPDVFNSLNEKGNR
jgi:hypothetical protein